MDVTLDNYSNKGLINQYTLSTITTFNINSCVYLNSTHPSMVISRTIIARADPGFPIGGDANPRGGGRQHMIIRFCQFPPKLHEIERIWIGGGLPGAPLDSPMNCICMGIQLFVCPVHSASASTFSFVLNRNSRISCH